MIAYAEQYAKEDVYLSPLLYGDKRNDKGNIARTPENALTSQTIYMDSDLCPPEKFRLMPSIHVVTSKGRGHDYWVLDKPVDAKRAAEIAHKITTAHREDGCDPSGWSANKVLRLPNTVNTGHGFPESVLAEISGTVYTIEEMENAYEHIDVYERPIMGRVTDAVEIVEPSDLPDYTDALNKVPADVLELALQEPILGPEGNRSEMRYRLLCRRHATIYWPPASHTSRPLERTIARAWRRTGGSRDTARPARPAAPRQRRPRLLAHASRAVAVAVVTVALLLRHLLRREQLPCAWRHHA
jgi:hypothetical protein